MLLSRIILAGTAVVCLGAAPAWAQSTITENVNNTGIPRDAPSLGLSNIYGLNPCATGTSVGMTTPLFGVGGAVSTIDKQCETRNNAAVVVTALKDEALAREILCEIGDIRAAAIRIGKPCLQDLGGAKVGSVAPPQPVSPASFPRQPAISASPAPQPGAPTATMPLQPGVPMVPAAGPGENDQPTQALDPGAQSMRPGAPAFCHVTGLDLTLYPECTGARAGAMGRMHPGAGKPVALDSHKPAPSPSGDATRRVALSDR